MGQWISASWKANNHTLETPNHSFIVCRIFLKAGEIGTQETVGRLSTLNLNFVRTAVVSCFAISISSCPGYISIYEEVRR